MHDKKKKVTVSEIKELSPKSEIYELNPHSKYLITVRKSELDIGGKMAEQKARVIMQTMSHAEIPCVVIIGISDDVKFFEIGD